MLELTLDILLDLINEGIDLKRMESINDSHRRLSDPRSLKSIEEILIKKRNILSVFNDIFRLVHPDNSFENFKYPDTMIQLICYASDKAINE